jgi:hypothetical protein
VVATHISTDTQLAASNRATQKAHATENTESASAIFCNPAILDCRGKQPPSLLSGGGFLKSPIVGFSSRAPPSLA